MPAAENSALVRNADENDTALRLCVCPHRHVLGQVTLTDLNTLPLDTVVLSKIAHHLLVGDAVDVVWRPEVWKVPARRLEIEGKLVVAHNVSALSTKT